MLQLCSVIINVDVEQIVLSLFSKFFKIIYTNSVGEVTIHYRSIQFCMKFCYNLQAILTSTWALKKDIGEEVLILHI